MTGPVIHKARHGWPGSAEWQRQPPPSVHERMRHRYPSWLAGLGLIAPSLILIGFFVYGFMGWNVRVSFTSWHGLTPIYNWVGLRNYAALWHDERWRNDVSNILVFTSVFVVGALALGFVMALLL